MTVTASPPVRTHVQPCGCGGPEMTCLAHRCQRCKRPGWDGVILADTEDWEAPLCCECFEVLGFAG